MNPVHFVVIPYTDTEQIILLATEMCTILGFIWAALTVPSEDILKAIKEKRRLDKLNGGKK